MTTTFTINNDNAISAFPTPDHAEAAIGAGALAFTTEKQLAKVTAEWPISRFPEIWNGFAGTPGFDKLKEVKKFENRAKAVARIWAAIQVLTFAEATLTAAAAPQAEPVAPAEAQATTKATRAAKTAAPAADAKPARAGTKKDEVIKMLKRKNGASNQEIQDAMNWQPHSVRGFIAGTLKKAGIVAESFKRANGDRSYRIV
jgi:hypothetical protein